MKLVKLSECKECGESDPDEFYGHTRSMCKSCRKEYKRISYLLAAEDDEPPHEADLELLSQAYVARNLQLMKEYWWKVPNELSDFRCRNRYTM